MQSAEEFMQCYLRERGEMDDASYKRSLVLHRKFFTEEVVKRLPGWHAQMGPETFVSLETSDTGTSAFTTQIALERELRRRYLLKQSGTSWQICRVEMGCNLCDATGQKGTAACPLCKGAGWTNYGPTAA
jgi:hypothetical protein